MEGDNNLPNETPSPSPVPNWEQIPDAPTVSYSWMDITDEFKHACDGLKLGELVHEPNFGLFEAMSAIEMMDPKMDAGMAGKQTQRTVLSLKQCIENNCIKLKDLRPCELIVIMDTCQACIMSWLDGQSLAQTVFTCLYLHDTDVIEDRCLRAYCLGILKLCDTIKEKIYKANVFEDEDFQTSTYGFKFAANVTELRVIGMLKEVEEEISRTIRSSKSKPHANENHVVSDDRTSNADHILELKAILARLKFLRIFLQVLLVFEKKEVELIQGSKKYLIQLSEQLKIIDRTLALGLAPTVSEDGHELVIGFEPLVNQTLLPPTFPRYTKLRKASEMMEFYGSVFKRFLSIIEMTSLQSFSSILDFIVEFAHSNPCVLTRCILQISFLPGNHRVFGQQLLTEVLKDSLRSFNSPPALSARYPTLLNNPQAKDCVDTFLSRAARVMNRIIRGYGHNYARRREKLASVLEDLATLQDEADRCDTELHGLMRALDLGGAKSHLTSIGSWTLYHTLRIMTQFVMSGFRLELYSDHEFHYIYWYLAEVLLSWQITTLNRAENQLLQDEMLAEQQLSAKSRSNKKVKKNKKKIRLHSHELKMCQGSQMIAAGCFKAMLGFFMDGKIKMPDSVFDSEAIRYEHRFLPFICVATPPFMPYKQFQDMTDVSQYFPPPIAQDLYHSSSKHFGQAKQHFETMHSTSEIQKLLLVTKTNLVVTKLLAGGHKKDSTAKPDFDFSVNSIFPIIRVT